MSSKLQELEFLTGHDGTADRFNEIYESVLSDARESGRYDELKAAQRLLFKQAMFLMRRHREESPKTVGVVQ